MSAVLKVIRDEYGEAVGEAPTLEGFHVPNLGDYASHAYNGDSPPTQWLVRDRLPRGKVVVLAAEGGVGKSYLTLELFSAINDGGVRSVWGGDVIRSGLPCLILSAEDDRGDVDNRLKSIRAKRAKPPAEHGYIIPCSDIGIFTLFSSAYPGGPVGETDVYHWLDETLGKMRAEAPGHELGFCAIDTLSALTSFNENDNNEAAKVMTGLSRLAAKHDVTIIVLHHFAKGQGATAGRIRGASAIVNSPRLAIGVEVLDDAGTKRALALVGATEGRALRMTALKFNGSVSRAPVTLAWPTGQGLTDVSNSFGSGGVVDDLVSVVEGFNQRGVPISKSGKADGIYALKSSAWPASVYGLARDKLQAAVQGALDTGRLYLDGSSLMVSKDHTQ